ncbi:MAG: hypothetical protein E7661_07190 [Ruminococcaceae bacterium]|nr:hypothetical protein [Oscillospiraceae bacterium]
MKKTMLLVSIILCITVLFVTTSCGTSNTPRVYEVSGTYDSNSLGAHKDEYDLSYHTGTEKSADKNICLPFGKETFTGVYSSTTSSAKYHDKLREYIGTTENGEDVHFSIHPTSGEIQRFSIQVSPANSNQEASSIQLTEDECLSVAQQFISENINSADDYKHYDTKSHDYLSLYGGALYVFFFCTTTDSVKTDESIIISISAATGRVEYYYASLLNAIEPSEIPEYDLEATNAAVADKVDEIYGDSGVHSYTHKITDLRITRLEDGKYYLRYVLDMNISKTAETQYPYSERVELLVSLGS